jgi:hypothetical protein
MKIGIIPNSDNFSHPADRRRYVRYFLKRNISYELADYNKFYDYIYVSISANLFLWSKYKSKYLNSINKPKVIFDLSDDLLSANKLNDFLRALLYFFLGKNPKLYLSYKKIIKNMISSSDLILCGSEEQRIKLLKYHSNIVVMREYVSQEISAKKNAYSLFNETELHIFWEGFSHGNIKTFHSIANIFRNFHYLNIHIHIVTDSEYCSVSGRYLCSSTYDVIKSAFKGSGIDFHLYDWNVVTFSAICSSCDIAFIPIPDDPIMLAKPENKLLLLWEIGIPTVTSFTDSYKRVMDDAGLDYVGISEADILDKIKRLAFSKENRLKYMKNASEYINNNASEKVIDSLWDSIFNG